jgi:hypothetical protein
MDYGVISEKICYQYANAAGARPLNPYMFPAATKSWAHMVETHSCHASLQYIAKSSHGWDGSSNHIYRCFVGYNP